MDRSAFLARRSSGIGGSDIGTVLGLNPWKPAAQLFVEKLGLYSDQSGDNFRAMMGTIQEPVVANLWTYWGGDMDSLIANMAAGNKVRKCRVDAKLYRSENYPFLLGNIDRRIVGDPGGVLECKTISGFYANMWEIGIPPMYLFQLQQYLLLTGLPFGELATLKDHSDFHVWTFDASAEMQQEIIERAGEFWSRIESARPFAQQYCEEEKKGNPDRSKLFDLYSKIREYEPGPDASPAYESFMRKRFPSPEGLVQGSPEHFQVVQKYQAVSEGIKGLEDEKQALKNQIIDLIGNAEGVVFDGAKVTLKPNSKGIKSLRIHVEA